MSVRSIFITGAGAGIGRATAQLVFRARLLRRQSYDVDDEGLAANDARLSHRQTQKTERTTTGALDVRDAEAFARRARTNSGKKPGDRST